ncbi:MAG: AEC family transporter, partial [Alphaproteobacteria bacterium]|nr:AEC family transporter [Alphaproteobacteria bacterium]
MTPQAVDSHGSGEYGSGPFHVVAAAPPQQAQEPVLQDSGPYLAKLRTIALPVLVYAGLVALSVFAVALRDVLALALPFFGMILTGYICGKLLEISEAGLAWMNAFIIYVALPALFFNLVHVTPIGELANFRFVFTILACTALAFTLAFAFGWIATRRIDQAAIQGVAGGYSNVGYMGPGLTLAALGTQSVVPTALIFVLGSTFFFTIVPLLMAFAATQGGEKGLGATLALVAKRVLTHPFNIATALGILFAALHVQPPATVGKLLTYLQGAAAPCALFVMGVTVALRPLKRISIE